MRHAKNLQIFFSLAAIIVFTFMACNSPVSPAGAKGSLIISLDNNINAKTLTPTISMDAANYTVTGTGPNSATFTVTTTGAAVTENGLAFGSWTIVVNALNASGDLIGTGTSTIQVSTGTTTTVSVTVKPISGNGTLSLTVNWPAAQVQTPSITATLTPALGTAQSLAFTVSGSTATYTNTAIGSGYYTLAFTVNDNGMAEAGAVEVVRIVAGQTTSGTYTFANVNQAGGGIQVSINADLQNPLDTAIAGAIATMSAGSTETLTASVSNYTGNVSYVWYVNGVSVGAGSSFTFGSGVSAGYYRIDVAAYSADGGRAGSATANVQMKTSTLVYVTNWASSELSGYSIGFDGSLTAFTTGVFSSGTMVAISPNGNFLYVTNCMSYGSDGLSAYSIGAGGSLTAITTGTFTTGSGPYGIAISPNGKHLYVANQSSNTLSTYQISTDGALTAITSGTLTTGSGPHRIAISPNGRNLYVTNVYGNTLSAYSIGTDGALTAISTGTFTAGLHPEGITISPNGRFLYVANQGSSGPNGLSAYEIGMDGALKAITSGTLATGATPYSIAISPNGYYLYVTNGGSNSLSAYSIGTDGALTTITAGTFSTGFAPMGIAISPDGSYLYVANVGSDGPNGLSAYSIGIGGALIAITSGTFTTGTSPTGIAIKP